MIKLTRVAGRIFGEPLAIERRKLDVIVSAIGPRLQGMPMDDEVDMPPMPPRAPVAARSDGIAEIQICGTLVAKSTGMDALSGMTSYADIAEDFSAALADPAVRGILLTVDSPGGEVKGMFELADMMYAARGQKPVCAHVECAASAAYLLASTADRVIVSQAGLTGSVGIIALHLDQSGADAQAGLKYTAIFAGDRKNDGNPHEPLTPEARSSIQGRIDKLNGMFIDAAARNRGMSGKIIGAMQAAQFLGVDGVDVGFADAVGTADGAVSLLSGAINSGAKSIYAKSFDVQRPPLAAAATIQQAASAAKEKQMAEELKVPAEATIPTAAQIEELVSKAKADGFAAAAEIVDLCAIAGCPASAAAFITARKPVAEVRNQLLAAKVAEQEKSAIDSAAQLGNQTTGTAAQPEGKAKPWTEVWKSLGAKTKGGN